MAAAVPAPAGATAPAAAEAWPARQLAEVESLSAIFFEDGAMTLADASALDALKNVDLQAQGNSELASPPLVLSVRAAGPPGLGLRLAAALPRGYPEEGGACPVVWLEPDEPEPAGSAEDAAAEAAAALAEDGELCAALQARASELASAGQECLLALVQEVADLARERLDAAMASAAAAPLAAAAAGAGGERGNPDDDEALALVLMEEELAALASQAPDRETRSSQPPLLGRRAMFSHHIIAGSKRQAICQWAVQLRLGGLAKIGWPGLIIVEGDERHVRAYVDALTRLRWKHFVVRGEQHVQGRAGQRLDDLRSLPLGFEEFGTDGMSSFADRCRQHGLEDLFLACLKMGRGAAAGHAGAAGGGARGGAAGAGDGRKTEKLKASGAAQKRGRQR